MDTNAWTILGIILGIIALLGIISWIWSKFSSSSSESSEVDMSMPITGGFRKWKRAMRKLRK
jgi:hypothetical protein